MKIKTNHLWILVALAISLALSGVILWLTQMAASAVFDREQGFLEWLVFTVPVCGFLYSLGLALCFATPWVGLAAVGEERMAELRGEDGSLPWKEFLTDPACLIFNGTALTVASWAWFGSNFVLPGVGLGLAIAACGLVRLAIQSRS